MQLRLNRIRFKYAESESPVFEDLTAVFAEGWTGIVGDNGCGKTTLAQLICGGLKPDAGTVAPGLFAVNCRQEVKIAPSNLEEFACEYGKHAVQLRTYLGIEDEWLWRYDDLSCGQKKRVQIACALVQNPDVLIADEPTNHVDAETRDAIAKSLSEFKGIGILISHDKELLDRLCTQCLFMESGRATMRPGSYTQAVKQMELERDSAQRAYEKMKKERARIAKETLRRHEEALRSGAKRSAAGLDKHDSDGRERKRLAVLTGKDGVAANLAAKAEKRLANTDARLESIHIDKRYEANLWIDCSPSARKTLLVTKPQEIHMGEMRLIVPQLAIGNRDHIAIRGNNGLGKTTLVRLIANELPSDSRLLYIPQEPSAASKDETLTVLRGLKNAEKGRVLSIVASLNSDPKTLMEGKDISPGEMRKLMLALGMLKKPEIVIMDEPTNHLDVGSTGALQSLLASYPAALLLVSHNREFLDASTEISWNFIQRENGDVQVEIK